MKSLSLILRIVAIVAGIAAAALFFISQGKLEEKQMQLEASQKATAATQAELETANGDIAKLEGRLKNEREALADTKDKLEEMRSEMYTARQEVTRKEQELTETKGKLTEAEGSARRLRADLIATEQQLAAASKETEIAQLNERIGELELANTTLKSDLEAELAIKAAKAPKKTVASNGTAGTSASGQTDSSSAAVQPVSIGAEAMIASVDTKNGIIVLSGASELGLNAGAEITLVRDLVAVGKIKIMDVQEDLAVASILPGAKSRQLIEGITVNLLL